MNEIAAEIIDIMRKKKLTLGTVESATGGLIAHLITNIPGSSDVFLGSIVSYSNEIKIKLAGVKKRDAGAIRRGERAGGGGNGGGRTKSARHGHLRGGYRHRRAGRRHSRKTGGVVLSGIVH